MLTVYSPEHIFHAPLHQFQGGRLEAHSETPERAFTLLEARATAWAVLPPGEFRDAVAARRAQPRLPGVPWSRPTPRWVAQGNDPAGVLPHTFASRHTLPLTPSPSPEGGGGQNYFHLPMGEGSGVRESSKEQAGLLCLRHQHPDHRRNLAGGAGGGKYGAERGKALLGGENCAYALCRPPGHHAGRDTYGGYCYLSNAAIAAQYLLEQGRQRTAILDIDLHHGNGTQQIFYERADVLYVSIHIDPATHYPHFFGYTQETGAGKGWGYNLNIPLPAGTGDGAYLEALAQALAAVQSLCARGYTRMRRILLYCCQGLS